MSAFSAAEATSTLKQFQRATVDHVCRRFFDEGARRYLVADETGLGKSLVGRGVVAHTIERLLDDKSVKRIDIIYVCSNADLAEQNLRRLDVLASRATGKRPQFADRLTLLALQADTLKGNHHGLAKPVNLISFTPGTSFETGSRTGKAEERALLAEILRRQLDLGGWDWRAVQTILTGAMDFERFRTLVAGLEDRPLDKQILKAFRRSFSEAKHRRTLRTLIETVGRRARGKLTRSEVADCNHFVGELRHLLAKASVDTLEPDLIILDEFQRFRHLLDPNGGEAAELAHALFEYDAARVLLLSATPYKPFTLAEEAADGDDHYSDFLKTLEFLSPGAGGEVASIGADLTAFRAHVLNGSGECESILRRINEQLLRLMCRTERPQLGRDGMLREIVTGADEVHTDDLREYAALHALAKKVDGALTVEYWKSAPYFANFMDGYKISERMERALADPSLEPEVRGLIGHTRRLDRTELERFTPVEPANARLRRLAESTLDEGWWKLPWLSPSLPYLEPSGPWSDPSLAKATKRLAFSSWAAAPSAIASLMSYEAERRIAEDSSYQEWTAAARDRLAVRLAWRTSEGRLASLPSLGLFWPHPGLAQLTDPLGAVADLGGQVALPEALSWAIDQISSFVPEDGDDRSTSVESEYWAAWREIPDGVVIDDITAAMAALQGEIVTVSDTSEVPQDEAGGIEAHVQFALGLREGHAASGRPTDLRATLAAVGMHGPGNIAWRAVRRLVVESDDVSDAAMWTAAATIGAGLRSLFSRRDIQLLVDKISESEEVYWRAVLEVCAAGNLQAVLDEYLFHLRGESYGPLNDDVLNRLALDAHRALSLRPARYQTKDPLGGDDISFTGRFARRLGSKRGDAAGAGDLKAMPEIRRAFNSPFWPFVLATTSVGQEGIDLHWWCHAVVHWNTPSSPVDFEQREGRVHRFGGHVIRRNIAAAHGPAMLLTKSHPWSTGWELASAEDFEHGDLSPHWIYPGPFNVERHVYPYVLSRDRPKYEKLKRELTLYRLAFGQPRQEDLVQMLQQRGVDADEEALNRLRVNLRPPLPVASADGD